MRVYVRVRVIGRVGLRVCLCVRFRLLVCLFV